MTSLDLFHSGGNFEARPRFRVKTVVGDLGKLVAPEVLHTGGDIGTGFLGLPDQILCCGTKKPSMRVMTFLAGRKDSLKTLASSSHPPPPSNGVLLVCVALGRRGSSPINDRLADATVGFATEEIRVPTVNSSRANPPLHRPPSQSLLYVHPSEVLRHTARRGANASCAGGQQNGPSSPGRHRGPAPSLSRTLLSTEYMVTRGWLVQPRRYAGVNVLPRGSLRCAMWDVSARARVGALDLRVRWFTGGGSPTLVDPGWLRLLRHPCRHLKPRPFATPPRLSRFSCSGVGGGVGRRGRRTDVEEARGRSLCGTRTALIGSGGRQTIRHPVVTVVPNRPCRPRCKASGQGQGLHREDRRALFGR